MAVMTQADQYAAAKNAEQAATGQAQSTGGSATQTAAEKDRQTYTGAGQTVVIPSGVTPTGQTTTETTSSSPSYSWTFEDYKRIYGTDYSKWPSWLQNIWSDKIETEKQKQMETAQQLAETLKKQLDGLGLTTGLWGVPTVNIPSTETTGVTQLPGGTIEGIPTASATPPKTQGESDLQRAIDIQNEVDKMASETEKQTTWKSKISNLFNKLATMGIASGSWILGLLGAGYEIVRDIVNKNRANGKADTEGMTSDQLAKYYEAAYNGYVKETEKSSTPGGNYVEGVGGGSGGATTTETAPSGMPTTTEASGGVSSGTTTATTTPADATSMDNTVAQYKKQAQEALEKYQENVRKAQEKYSSSYDASTQKATEQARKIASTEAALAQAKQQTALRNLGQSSSAAAVLASQNVVNNFLEVFNKNYSEALTNQENRALKEFDTELETSLEALRQNKDILEQEIEFQGKLITVKSLLTDLEIKKRQFDIAMEQYETAKLESERAEAWQKAKDIGGFLVDIYKIFRGNETGASSVSGGMWLVGEKGPEIIELPEGSKVVPASATKEILDSSSKDKVMKFFEDHKMIDKSDFPVNTSCVMKSIGQLEDFIKNNKKKDWNGLKIISVKEGNYKDSLDKLGELLNR